MEPVVGIDAGLIESEVLQARDEPGVGRCRQVDDMLKDAVDPVPDPPHLLSGLDVNLGRSVAEALMEHEVYELYDRRVLELEARKQPRALVGNHLEVTLRHLRD